MSIVARRFQRTLAANTTGWVAPPAERAGAVALGSTNYSIPSSGTVVYVATNGSNANAGTLAAPKATLAGALAVTGGSGTIVVRSGVYETSSLHTIPANGSGLAIQAYPGETVWFDGSRVATSWTNNGNGTWSTSYTKTLTRITDSSWGHSANPNAGITDQCWIDGVRQTAIADAATPSAGQFSVNQSADTLTIATNPSGKTVRVSEATNLLLATSPLYLYGVGVRRYSPQAIEWTGAAIYAATNDKIAGTVIENCYFDEIGVTAINLSDNSDVTIRSNTITNCGHAGLFASGGSGLVTKNLIQHINHKQWNPEPTTGAMKIIRTDYMVVTHNYVTDVYNAMGIWLDVSNTRFTVAGNYVDGSVGSLGAVMRVGIHLEESDGGKYNGTQYRSICAANTVVGAETGVKLLASGYIDVVNNTLVGSNGAGGSIYIQQDRIKNPESTPANKTQEQCPWWTVGNRVINNRFGDGKRQFFMTGNYTTYGIAALDYVDAIAGNWCEPVSSGNTFCTLTDYSNAYKSPASWTAWKALPNIGNTAKIGTNYQGAGAPVATDYALPAENAWAAAVGYPAGYQTIGNPLNPLIMAES